MEFLKEIPFKVNLPLFVLIFLFLYLLKHIWDRRWLYYYASKLEGPPSLPLIGCIYYFRNKYDGDVVNKTLFDLSTSYSSVFKLWVGPDLYIVNTRPEDLEILLSKFLEKSSFYKLVEIFFNNGLVTEDIELWRKHRKIISHSFNPKILHTFIDVFNKHTKKLLERMTECCEENEIDMFPKFWRSTLDMACENLLDLNPEMINKQDKFISVAIGVEEIGFKNWTPIFLVIPKFFWKYWNIIPFVKRIISWFYNFTEKLIKLKQKELHIKQDFVDDNIKRKQFLNNLITLMNENNTLSEQEITGQVHTMLVAASESTALTISFLTIVLALHKDVQEKVYEEVSSILEGRDGDITLEDINKMNYTERVIKETMRLLPALPVIARYVSEDIEINSVVYPKSSNILIPIIMLHRNPELWDDPLTFNPDRFLPENSKNRHRCAYMPFSFGPRSCIGFKYGMISMMVQLSNIVRRYEIISVNYKSMNDIELVYCGSIKPKDGCKILLKRRKI